MGLNRVGQVGWTQVRQVGLWGSGVGWDRCRSDKSYIKLFEWQRIMFLKMVYFPKISQQTNLSKDDNSLRAKIRLNQLSGFGKNNNSRLLWTQVSPLSWSKYNPKGVIPQKVTNNGLIIERDWHCKTCQYLSIYLCCSINGSQFDVISYFYRQNLFDEPTLLDFLTNCYN